jgi:Tol biopolymer transport system component
MRAMTGIAVAVVGAGVVAASPSPSAPANGSSYADGVSAEGRYVAFTSDASNLVAGDTNRHQDVYVRDLVARTTQRVSLTGSGSQVHDHAFGCGISADGRYIALESQAAGFVPHDTNHASDVFVRDRRTGKTQRVSVSSTGVQGNGDLGTAGCAMSADGRYVAFTSYSSNLVPGDTNKAGDVFVRDRVTGTTERVSVSSTGEQGDDGSGWPDLAISADGRYVAFTSLASNLVAGDTNDTNDLFYDLFLHDRVTGATVLVATDARLGSLSADGRYTSFSPLTSGSQSFVYDRATSATELVSVGLDGAPGNAKSYAGSLSADGRYVAFTSLASNLVARDTNDTNDVFVRDRVTGVTSRVSSDQLGAVGALITSDGRFVVYQAPWTCGDRSACVGNLHLHDLAVGRTTLVTVGRHFKKKAP